MADGKVIYDIELDDSSVSKDLNSADSKIKSSAQSTSAAQEKYFADAAEKIGESYKQVAKDINSTNEDISNNSQSTFDKLGSFVTGAAMSIGQSAIDMGIDLAKGLGEAILGNAMSLDSAMQQFAASTGTAQEELASYEETLKSIYGNNYGESFEDIATKMGLVKQQLGEIDNTSLQTITEGLYALEDTFEMDFNETLRGTEQLMVQFGISAEEALDLMAKGGQEGLDYTGELGDNIAEYAGKFAQAGYSAEEYFQLLKNGADGGSYNLDKVNDAINEVTTRLSDGTIADALGSFSTETQEVFAAWQNGGATQKEVIESIVNDIKECTSEQEALTMAATAFGTMGEDANLDFVESLSAVGDEFEETKGAMESLQEVKYDDLNSMFEGLTRTVELLLLPLGEALIPILNSLVTAIMPVLTSLLQIIIEPLTTILSVILPPLVEILTTLLSPLTMLAETLLPPLIELWQTLEEPLNELLNAILPPLNEIFIAILSPITTLIDSLLPPLIELWNAIIPILETLTPILELLASIILDNVGAALDAVTPLIEGFMTILNALISFITNVFQGDWEGAWESIGEFARGVFNAIPSAIESAINAVISVINKAIDGINTVTGVVGISAIPHISKVSLPRFHSGGIFESDSDEGLAVLRQGEMILTEAQQAELFAIANGAGLRGDSQIVAHFELKGDVEMDGFKVGRMVLRNLDDAAAFTLKGR